MLWKGIKRLWKSALAVISCMVLLGSEGCSDVPREESGVLEKESEIRDICLDLFEKAKEEQNTDQLEIIRSIVNRFGEYGYPAVDSKNQIDMTEAEQVIRFCKKVDAQEKVEIAIFVVDDTDGLIKYELQAKDGNVEVTRSYYEYKDGAIQRNFVGGYLAEDWNYTKEGYLMFSGVYFSEEVYAITLEGMEEYTALRVEPLDEEYRELNRKYLLPVGYECNNMFIVDWSEHDFGELNFYDLYDIFYRKLNGGHSSYIENDKLGSGVVYQVPCEEFESVIKTYLNIDSKTLQSKTVYCREDSTYEYKLRGFDEVEYPEYPYSEVTGFTKNSDGTITLMARVVFPYRGDSNVYAHEVTVRPLENGGVQYVSNKIVPSEDNGEITWHRARLTAEEWEELYGVISRDSCLTR